MRIDAEPETLEVKPVYDTGARKRAVNLTLNEDLVAQARSVTPNLSAVVEALLADFLAREKQKRADAIEAAKETCATWNRVYEQYGSPADEYSNLEWRSSTFIAIVDKPPTALRSL
jgi:post-segregation antitoxin (ccd killing protein)